jgi:hypothetical protein
MLPQPRSWLDLGPTSLSWGWLHRSGFFGDLPMEHEHRIGLGLLAGAVAIVGLWIDRRRPAQQVMALTALTIVALTIHVPGVERPFWQNVYQFVPAAGAIRGVTRIVMVLLIPAAAGLGAFVDGMLRLGVGRALTGTVVLLVIFEQAHALPSYDKRAVRDDVARIARDIDPSCVAFLWNPAAEDPDPYWKWPIDAMWAQMESGVPTMNGFSGQRPPGYPIDQVPLWGVAHELLIGEELDHWVTMNHLDASRICWVKGKSTKGADGARFVSQTVPTELHAGERAEASLTFQNIGRTSWRPHGKVRLGAQERVGTPCWGPARVELEHAVAPGETVTFTVPLHAPEETGIRHFRWQMVREGIHWFGTVNPVTQIRVLPRDPAS